MIGRPLGQHFVSMLPRAPERLSFLPHIKAWLKKAPHFDGAKFGGASGLDGHGVILVVAVTLYGLRFRVLGIRPDRRQGVEHGVRQPLVKQGIVLILGQNSSNFGAIGDP